MDKTITITSEVGTQKDTGRQYKYVSIKNGTVELTRLFIKPTEVSFYDNLYGTYSKQEDKK